MPGYVFQLPRAREGWELKLQRRLFQCTLPTRSLCSSSSRFDVKSIVLSLRQQRNPCMVQTFKQYYFLYEILRDALIEAAVIARRKKAPIPLSISHPSLSSIPEERPRTPSFLRSHSGGESMHALKLSGHKRKLSGLLHSNNVR